MAKPLEGKSCHICGKPRPLTFEHLPPRKAFNSSPIRKITGDDWIKQGGGIDLVGGALQQRGAGGKTLCNQCNNDTGSWYVPELIQWCQAGMGMLSKLSSDEEADLDPNPRIAHVIFKDVYPLRFLKQFVAMILSTAGPSFREINSELSNFTLYKHRTGISNRYAFCLALYRGPGARFIDLAGKLDTKTGEKEVLSEIAYPPFSYVLRLVDKQRLSLLGDISPFANYDYDQKDDIELKLLVGFGHTFFPADYRSKVAIEEDVQA